VYYIIATEMFCHHKARQYHNRLYIPAVPHPNQRTAFTPELT